MWFRSACALAAAASSLGVLFILGSGLGCDGGGDEECSSSSHGGDGAMQATTMLQRRFSTDSLTQGGATFERVVQEMEQYMEKQEHTIDSMKQYMEKQEKQEHTIDSMKQYVEKQDKFIEKQDKLIEEQTQEKASLSEEISALNKHVSDVETDAVARGKKLEGQLHEVEKTMLESVDGLQGAQQVVLPPMPLLQSAASQGEGSRSLLAWSNRSEDLFEGCRAKPQLPRRMQMQMVASKKRITAAGSSAKHKEKASCADGEFAQYSYSKDAATTTCCAEDSRFCVGCSDQECQRCAAGFQMVGTWPESFCAPCADSAGWLSLAGETCAQLDASSGCNGTKVKGQSSNEACCACGGGHLSASPFRYQGSTFAVGEDIVLKPHPQTADFYAVSDDCELADYNLTINPKTGTISKMQSGNPPREPFKAKCEVTAVQAKGLKFTAALTIRADHMAYPSPVVLAGPSAEVRPKLSEGEWSGFQLEKCIPDIRFVEIDAATGALSLKVGGDVAGGVLDPSGTLEQAGAKCIVTASHKTDNVTDNVTERVAVVAVERPIPMESLNYNPSEIVLAVGEQAPELRLQVAEAADFREAKMQPTEYTVACDSSAFRFDESLRTGFFLGHPILEIGESGEIDVSAPASLSYVFDSGLQQQPGQRHELYLDCTVWGSFPDAMVPPIRGSLQVRVLDNICWVEQQIASATQDILGPGDEATCRHACRLSPWCSHFSFSSGKCLAHYLRPGGTVATVFAKQTTCDSTSACMQVSGLEAGVSWHMTGYYCPSGVDALRGEVVFQKKGLTPREMLWLTKYASEIDGGAASCSAGDWVLYEVDLAADTVVREKGIFELRGPRQGCVGAAHVTFALAGCGALPGLSTPTPPELQPYILDDPATSEPEDHWLHPCDCPPQAWGIEAPASLESFTAIPPYGSGTFNLFTPPSFPLVSGQFACPSENLVEGGSDVAVHFGTEASPMDLERCQSMCESKEDCAFFFVGTQGAAQSCRLYRSCDFLLREVGLEGQLFAVPREESCHVADPEACWATTLRHVSLVGDAWAPDLASYFRYFDLHTQCDEALLMGGVGVDECAKPTYRDPVSLVDSSHKRPLPDAFDHGAKLVATCWAERYRGLKSGAGSSQEEVHCVNGEWINRAGLQGLEGFMCGACVRVAPSGYREFEQRNEQELFWMSKVSINILTDISQSGSTPVQCLGPVGPGSPDDMAMHGLTARPCETRFHFDSDGSPAEGGEHVCFEASFVDTDLLSSKAISPTPAPGEVELAAHTAATSMLSELSGFAAQASLRAAGRKTALGALRRFSETSVKLDNRSSPDDAALALSQLASLHATLRQAGAGSKMEAVATQMTRDARQLQQRALKHREVLGVYRWHSNFTRGARQRWQALWQEASARQSLQQMDHLWWTLRDSLDDYLDAAEYEISAYEKVFSAISSYEGCGSTSTEVSVAYGQSLAAKEYAGRHLKASWRKSTNLIGEMAAVIDDGAIFQTLMSVEGCNSTLSLQTMLQSRYAVSGMLFLVDRFKASGLAAPDLDPLLQTVKRMTTSYESARASCKT